MNKKICFVIPFLKKGGAQRVAIQFANYLFSKKYSVDILVLNNEGIYFDEIQKDINLINLNKTRSIFSFFNLITYIKKNNPDILFASQPHVLPLLYLIKKITFWKGSLVVRETNNKKNYFHKKYSFFSYFLFNIIQYIYSKVDLIIAPSFGIYEQINKKNCIHLNNPINIEEIKKKQKEKIDENFLIDNDFIICVGEFTDQKRYEDVIKSFHECKNKDLILVFLGDGYNKNKYVNLVNYLKLGNRVFFLGLKKNPYKYMALSKALIVSSDYEGMPNVILQALVCKTQIISSDCNFGPSEILENGKFGYLYPIGNLKKLTELIDLVTINKKFKNYNIEKIKILDNNKILKEFNTNIEKLLRK